MHTLTNGATTAGYSYDVFPGGGTISTGWNTYGYMWFTAPPQSPVSDFNIHGVVVGVFDSLSAAWAPDATSDFLSRIDKWHSFYPWDLNNAIAPLPGVELTRALLIDDDGRILASGSDSHVYLLTPPSLGAPATVPEPGAVAVWGLVALAAALRCRAGRIQG